MATGKCQSCGKITNSVVSDYAFSQGTFTKCYAAYENNKWIKGCAFDEADNFTKAYAMHLITGKDVKSFLIEGKHV